MTAGGHIPETEPRAADSNQTKATRARSEILFFLELFALSGLVFAQPLLDSLKKNATDVFVTANASPFDIILLTALIVFAPALLLWIVCFAIGLIAPRARPYLHAGAVGALVALLVYVVITRQLELATAPRWILAATVGAAAGALTLKSVNVRLYLRILAVAPIIFALLFVTNDRISPLALHPPVGALDVAVASPNRVVMIVFDELPLVSLLGGSGTIDEGAFPNFASLAGDATWYRNTTSVAPFTPIALPALVTGRYPIRADTVPIAARYPNSLFTLLGETYRFNAREIWSEQLCPASLCTPEKGSADIGDLVSTTRTLWDGLLSPPSQEAPKFFDDGKRASGMPAGNKFLASLRESDEPTFDYLHVLLPHQPWNRLPGGQSYPDDDGLVPGRDPISHVWTEQGYANSARQRHLLQLQATDAFLGKVVTKLHDIGAYEDSLIVVTADHGAAFTEGSALRDADARNYPEIMWVPLFVHTPGQTTGRVDDRSARAIDVLPTIADALGAEIPWEVDGRSLLGEPHAEKAIRFADLDTRHAFRATRDPAYKDFDGEQGFTRVLEARPFAYGGDAKFRFYGIDGWSTLVGHQTAAMPPGPPTGVTMSVLNKGDYRDVDPRAPEVPWTNLQAKLSRAQRHVVAIAVNGTVAGVTETIPNENHGVVNAMLAPEFFVDGDNEIRLFDLTGTPQRPRLAEISGTN